MQFETHLTRNRNVHASADWASAWSDEHMPRPTARTPARELYGAAQSVWRTMTARTVYTHGKSCDGRKRVAPAHALRRFANAWGTVTQRS